MKKAIAVLILGLTISGLYAGRLPLGLEGGAGISISEGSNIFFLEGSGLLHIYRNFYARTELASLSFPSGGTIVSFGTGWILKATGEIETSPIQPSPAPLPHPQKTYTSPPSSTPIQQEKSEYAKRLEYLNNKLSVEIEGHWISSYSEASSYYNYNLGEALEAIIGGKKGAEIGSYFKPYNIGTGEKSGSTRLSYIKEWTPYHGGVLVSEPEFYRIAGLHKQAKLCAQYYNSYYNNARALRNKGYTVMLNGLLMGALGTPAFIWGFKNQNTDKDSEADILMAIGIIDWCIGGLDVIIGTGMVWVGAARLQAKLPKWGTASFALDVAITYNNHLKKKLGLSE